MSQNERDNFTNGEKVSFFGRHGEEVISQFAARWVRHQDRRQAFEGQNRILGLDTPNGNHFFRVDEAILYDDEYTKTRWPRSRALHIASLEPGEVVGYAFHQSTLTFIKTGNRGSAENIQLSSLSEVDRFGNPINRPESKLSAAKVAQLIGLRHQMHAQLTAFNFRGETAFLLSTGGRLLTPEEIKALEEEIFGDNR